MNRYRIIPWALGATVGAFAFIVVWLLRLFNDGERLRRQMKGYPRDYYDRKK